MKEDYSKESGKNYSNERWKKGKHIRPMNIIENFEGEGWRSISKKYKTLKDVEIDLNLLITLPKYSGLTVVRNKVKEILIYTLDKKSLEEVMN